MPSINRPFSFWSVQVFLDLRWISRLTPPLPANTQDIPATAASLVHAREKDRCVKRGDTASMWDAVVCFPLVLWQRMVVVWGGGG